MTIMGWNDKNVILKNTQHIQVHFGVDFQADYKDVRWHDVALT